jgi:hypothetical protein
MHKPRAGLASQGRADLIEMTATSLSGHVVALILLAIQKGDLELNIMQAVKW